MEPSPSRPSLLERLSALLMREPEDREQLIALLHSAFERNLRAELVTGYFDLIYDRNPDFTVKNQVFFDSMDQYKISNQPFSPKNDVLLWENKLTAVKKVTRWRSS